jgi:hypothetical protein
VEKQFIIQEIKRTASENAGVPLGWRRFETETGIKYYDWFGVYWARWNDALREAGFSPNQLTAAYESEDLLGKYAELARELGRLPVVGDLRLKRRKDPEFPGDKTFRRLGTKAKLIAGVQEYCGKRSGYEDVLALCRQHPVRPERNPSPNGNDVVEIGEVYLIKSGRYYKIGKTIAVGRREREIALQLPEKVTKVHVIRTDDPAGIEAYWHTRFDATGKNGEWFDLSQADVSAFRRRKFM